MDSTTLFEQTSEHQVRSLQLCRLYYPYIPPPAQSQTIDRCNNVRYNAISKDTYIDQEFRDNWLKDYYLADRAIKKIPADIRDRLFRKLQLIDDATSDSDLRAPTSNRFEKLSGRLTGKHSIRVTIKWRLVFEWDGSHGEAHGMYLDNHDYR